MAMVPAAILAIIEGIKNGDTFFRAAVKQLFAVFHKGGHAADSGADIDSQPFRLHSADNAAVLHSLGRGGQGVLV